MNLYEYLKNEYRLPGNIQIFDEPDQERPSHFSDFRYSSYYGRVLEDIDKLKDDDISKAYFFPNFLSFGDYDNSTFIERSNVQVFLDMFEHIDGVCHIYGAYNSEAVVICLDTSLNDNDLIEVLEALESYPVIDENHATQLEIEMIEEAWYSYGRDEIKNAYFKEFEEEISDKKADEIRNNSDYSGNQHSFIEAGGIVYFDIDAYLDDYKEAKK